MTAHQPLLGAACVWPSSWHNFHARNCTLPDTLHTRSTFCFSPDNNGQTCRRLHAQYYIPSRFLLPVHCLGFSRTTVQVRSRRSLRVTDHPRSQNSVDSGNERCAAIDVNAQPTSTLQLVVLSQHFVKHIRRDLVAHCTEAFSMHQVSTVLRIIIQYHYTIVLGSLFLSCASQSRVLKSVH